MTNDETMQAVITRALSEEAGTFVPRSGWARSLDELLQRAASAPPAQSPTIVRRIRRAPAIAVAAVAVAVVATVALLPSPPAAAWWATPALGDGTARAELAADCQDMLDTSAPAVLVEQRGTSHLTILADSSQCLTAGDLPGLEGAGALLAGGRDVLPVHQPGPGQVQVVHAGSLGGVGATQVEAELPDGAGSAGYMAVIGRVGTQVRKIVIHTVDHGDVVASMQNGWFAAWWPSTDGPVGLTVTTGAGTYDLDL